MTAKQYCKTIPLKTACICTKHQERDLLVLEMAEECVANCSKMVDERLDTPIDYFDLN